MEQRHPGDGRRRPLHLPYRLHPPDPASRELGIYRVHLGRQVEQHRHQFREGQQESAHYLERHRRNLYPPESGLRAYHRRRQGRQDLQLRQDYRIQERREPDRLGSLQPEDVLSRQDCPRKERQLLGQREPRGEAPRPQVHRPFALQRQQPFQQRHDQGAPRRVFHLPAPHLG